MGVFLLALVSALTTFSIRLAFHAYIEQGFSGLYRTARVLRSNFQR